MVKTGYSPEKLRTFALIGHRSAGKTTVGDALLRATGVTRTMGRVSQGSSLLDHKPLARKKGMTTEPSFAWMPWQDTMLQMVDLPGGVGFMHQAELMLANTDAFVLTISAPDGLEAGAERGLELAKKKDAVIALAAAASAPVGRTRKRRRA